MEKIRNSVKTEKLTRSFSVNGNIDKIIKFRFNKALI